MNGDAYKYVRFNSAQESRWATREEMERSAVHVHLEDEDYAAGGLPLLSNGEDAYVDGTDTHSLIFGATGSKKTRLFCMPLVNILAKAGESFIVSDPKGEIYAQTSGLVAQKGYKTVVLNFRDLGYGDMWNPLSLPYELWQAGLKDDAGFLLADLVSALAEKQVTNSKDVFWPEAAQGVAIAGLYLLMGAGKEEEINMTSFTKLCTFGAVPDLKDLTEMLDPDSIPSLNYKSTICIKADATISGMVASLGAMLRVFNINKRLAKMLSKTTFDIRKFGREKTAVYMILPDEKTTYNFLITTFVKQAYEILISEAQKEENRQLPVRVNFVLDEFCNIPKIPDMASMISAARSRNMRFFLVAQSLHQLQGKYGDDADSIKGNCENWVFLSSKELPLLNEISELCGNVSLPDGRTRRLISTSELQRLSKEKGEALIMHARLYPLITEMTDISDYPMFNLYEPLPMLPQDVEKIKSFSLPDLLEEIKEGKAVAPFGSREHYMSQGKTILKQEFDKELKELDEKLPEHSKGSLSKRLEGYLADKRDIKNASPACLARVRARIVALMGEEFAEEFMSVPIAEIMKIGEDDDDWF